MQFKHPEILWALLLLIIPILIHLFQLRRFQKVPFTNVQFLKEVTIQTRKSSQLKKWLVLCSRLLLFAAAVLAFAQPYFANRNITTTSRETVIYLDNSFSMQMKGEKGPLLERAVQELLSNIPDEEEITLFTNDNSFPKGSIKAIRNELLQLPYSPEQLDINEILLKGRNSFSRDGNSLKNLLVISDFQQKNGNSIPERDSLINVEVVKLSPVRTDNISIDSIYISRTTPSNIELEAVLSTHGNLNGEYPVSFYNQDKLMAKVSADFNGNSGSAKVNFTIPSNEIVNGRLTVEDDGLQYDNSMYFNINATEKINVMAINGTDGDFLNRIFTQDEFNLGSYASNELDYSAIERQNLIVLNELKDIPNSLSNALDAFYKKDGKIILIPSADPNFSDYSRFMGTFGLGAFTTVNTNEKRITGIQFSHPVYQDVFDKQVSNFQYPKVSMSFDTSARLPSLLDFEDGNPFLYERNGIYVFASPLNKDISNFKNSPLIVPTFYSIGKKSLQLAELYYLTGRENQVDVKTSIQQDAILNIENGSSQFIPLQQSFPDKVTITTNENPSKSGTYTIKNNDIELQNISFNYPRNESNLSYRDISDFQVNAINDSVDVSLSQLNDENNINELWKWFVIFALIFLLAEILLLKYLK
ncbi:hypothetical protein GWK08_10210 [Leptobacterium flavescens]|uniref:Aerotolerance regulator N-terminal domain-containing protein n=1 Tax=Leptobacterium flavescens TaxID=472055 RepID=A0A6P0UKR5_9FLAO|nr:BatA domain-containing protein [Leptobacterium flavescens]NER13814.1 hypothetical protein [Leptobacterium flavescens]